MVSIPFIYFTLLFIYHMRKTRWQFDIASFILAIYALSAFFSILIDMFDLRSIDTYAYKISFSATFAYCGLISLCTYPFMSYSNFKIKRIEPIRNNGVLKFFAIVFFYFLRYQFSNVI